MKFILILLCIFEIGCQSKSAKQDTPTFTNIIEPKNARPEIWTEYSIKDSIPKILIKRLNELSENSFELANPNDPFQSTDVIINEKLPWRQLRFLGKSENFWTMTYKHGGIGLHYHFVSCKIAENEIKLFRTGVSLVDLETITQIKGALSDQKIEFKNIELTEEYDKI